VMSESINWKEIYDHLLPLTGGDRGERRE
jgi:hypothetical protein